MMRRIFLVPAIAFALALVHGSGALGATVSLNPVLDNTLYQSAAGSLSNARGQFLFAGRNSQSNTRRTLVQFDLAAAIPAGATITSATLIMTASSGGPEVLDFSLHRALASWGEGTSAATGSEGMGAPATTGDATWLHRFFNTSLWSAQGGDFSAASSATTSLGDVGAYAWAGAAMAMDAQSWLDSPATNFGWLIRGGESAAGSAKRFNSRENTDIESRPTLIIEYTPVPAPATMMLGLGALACDLPRRRIIRKCRGEA